MEQDVFFLLFFDLPSLRLHHHLLTKPNHSMKKIITLTTLLALGMFTQANAQFILGGNIGFNSSKETDEVGSSKEEYKSTTITVMPRLAYGFGNNWAGLDVGIMTQSSESPRFPSGTNESKSNLINVAPFFRHIQKPTDNFGIWIEAQAGVGFGKSEVNGTETGKISAFGAGIRPGVIFFIGDHLSFEASFGRLGFNQTTFTDANDSNNKETYSDFGLNLNNNGIGISALGVINSSFLFGANWSF